MVAAFILSIVTGGFAQSSATLEIHASNADQTATREARQLSGALYNELRSAVKVINPGLFALDVSFEKGKSRTVEGMETRTYVDLTMSAELRDNATGELLWSDQRTVQGKSSSGGSAANAGFKKYARLTKGDIQAVIDSVTAVYESDCAGQLSKVKTDGADEQLQSALQATAVMAEGSCASEAVALADEIIAEMDKRLCDAHIHEIEVKIKAGTLKGRDAVNKLLMFSPDSPCSEKVMELAELLGSRLDSRSNEMLSNYVVICNLDDSAVRQSSYRQLRWNK